MSNLVQKSVFDIHMYDIIDKVEKFYERVTLSSYLKTHPTASCRSLFCSLPFQLRVLTSSAYLCSSWLTTAKMFYKTIQRREGSLRFNASSLILSGDYFWPSEFIHINPAS